MLQFAYLIPSERKVIMPGMESQKYWTPREVAERFKVSEETVRRYIREGKLKAIKFGNSYRISDEALQEFLDKQRKAE